MNIKDESKHSGVETLRASETLDVLFKAYFDNKMTILLLMVEHPKFTRSPASVAAVKCFLHDLYHHFLDAKAPLKYRRAFRWVIAVLERYPDLTYRQIYRAIKMIALIYEAFGYRLAPRMEEFRYVREM